MKKKIKKNLTKKDREDAVLLGLIQKYIQTNRPIGSNVLQESGFEFLSSATIRNYFHKLEHDGFLKQSHASGGRIPTTSAFRYYANHHLLHNHLPEAYKKKMIENLLLNDREISSYLTEAAEKLSEYTDCSVLLTSPRFDQDFLHDIQLFRIMDRKILFVLITDFGLVRTETLSMHKPITDAQMKKIQELFLWKIGKGVQPKIEPSLLKIAQYCYNEIMVRHIVGYANFHSEEIYRSGLSKLLSYPEFNDPVLLAKNLALFEDFEEIRPLLAESMKIGRLTLWIGNELKNITQGQEESTVMAIPYSIHERVVGAVAILGPMRLDYPKLFGILTQFSKTISSELTKSIYRYKISYREPQSRLDKKHLETSPSIYLEDKTS